MKRPVSRHPTDIALGLECAWPGVSEPRQARLFRSRIVRRLGLVTFVLSIFAAVLYGEGVSERGQ
jgi:hypothetical protein